MWVLEGFFEEKGSCFFLKSQLLNFSFYPLILCSLS